MGRNSCGKSTFLRTYPLLRQSVESNTRSPILWYGSYVDFGDLSTAVHDGADKIFFDFTCKLDVNINQSNSFMLALHEISGRRKAPENIQIDTSISIGLNLRKDKQIQSNSVVRIGNTEIVITHCAGQVQDMVCTQYSQDEKNQELCQLAFSNLYIISKGSILPASIYGTKEGKDASGRNITQLDEDAIKNSAQENLINYLKKFSSTPSKTLTQRLEFLKLTEIENIADELVRAIPNDKKLRTNLLESSREITESVYFFLVVRSLAGILSAADKSFKDLFSGVRYLGPVRASAERFYRHQDLEIGEVDHKGENLPMVINSLDSKMKRNLSTWMSENFGFELELEASGLHYELKIKDENDSKFHNISDMGFGYSQILPVIVSIWLETVASKNRRVKNLIAANSRTLVIEQPELHLHPALQHRFGLAIAKVASLASGSGFRIVIETHSSQMIEAIGESIRKGTIEESDVSIALFEKNESDCTEVTMSGFDNEGYLMYWPAGFLSA